MPGFKPGIGTIPKYGSEFLKWHFAVPKPDSVADTQGDPLNTNPAIITVKKCAIAGARILQEHETVIGQFYTGMETGHRWVFKNEFAACFASAGFDLHSITHMLCQLNR